MNPDKDRQWARSIGRGVDVQEQTVFTSPCVVGGGGWCVFTLRAEGRKSTGLDKRATV